MFFDTIKANVEISKLNKELADLKTDRDLQVTKLETYEKDCKDFIASAQTAEQMKEAHKLELDKVTKEFESKLADKDKELAALKEAKEKELKEVKESVAQEAISIVASQGTNVIIDTAKTSLTPQSALEKLKSLKGQDAQNFYMANKQLFEGYIKNPSAI
jgi:hypothetical protein